MVNSDAVTSPLQPNVLYAVFLSSAGLSSSILNQKMTIKLSNTDFFQWIKHHRIFQDKFIFILNKSFF